MKKIIFSLLICFTFMKAEAQQDAMFTHYMYNTQAINPGYAGTRDALTITGLHRSQWVGFKGAPETQTLTIHTPIINNKLGVGLSILNDKIGPTNSTSVNFDGAYRLPVSEKGILSFGLKGGLNIMSNNINSLKLDEGSDPLFQNNIGGEMLPNVGVGLYYYQEKFYVGLSAPKLIENSFASNVSGGRDLAIEKRHYFLIAGFVTSLTDNIEFKPTTFIKVTNGAPAELDLTGTLIFDQKFWGGLMFRTGDALGALIGMNLNNQLSLGYSFDWSYGLQTFKYNYGSHELMLRYDFIYKNQKKIKSPRYF